MNCHCKWKLGENKEISINPGKIYKVPKKAIIQKRNAKRRKVQKSYQDKKQTTFRGHSFQKGENQVGLKAGTRGRNFQRKKSRSVGKTRKQGR